MLSDALSCIAIRSSPKKTVSEFVTATSITVTASVKVRVSEFVLPVTSIPITASV